MEVRLRFSSVLDRRLTSNPSYYDPSLMVQDMTSGDSRSSSSSRRAAIAAFVDSAVCTALDDLLATDALKLRMPTRDEMEGSQEGEKEETLGGGGGGPLEPILESTPLGRIACLNYISPRTAKKLSDALKFQEYDPAQSLDENYDERRRRRLNFVDIIKLLSDVDEFKQMPVR